MLYKYLHISHKNSCMLTTANTLKTGIFRGMSESFLNKFFTKVK